jgi:hypothetical protein
MKHLGNGLCYSFTGEVLPLFWVITCALASAFIGMSYPLPS